MPTYPLVIGLGNPGPRYRTTRHNLGFLLIDALISSPQVNANLKKQTPDYDLWTVQNNSSSFQAAKPLTFMNLSGRAVRSILKYSSSSSDQILVIHDELDLAFGQLRLKNGGGLAGHNGLKSIAEHLGTRNFHRLRVGIGRPDPGINVAGYVLGKLPPDQLQILPRLTDTGVDAILSWLHEGIDKAMQELHSTMRAS